MTGFLLTWNPKKWTMPADELDELIQETQRGGRVAGDWSTGVRKSGVTPGDTAFLIRQGVDRGLVAQGAFTSDIQPRSHWDGGGRVAGFANIEWCVWLPAGDELPIAELEAHVPEVKWSTLQGGGVRLGAAAQSKLERIWSHHLKAFSKRGFAAPEEVPETELFHEGDVERVLVNRYERNPRAREEAIAFHGAACVICGFDFGEVYGDLGAGFIHVHHLRELSSLPEGYEVDPHKDLIPICPNCHAMVHRRRPALTPADLEAELDSAARSE